jgi:cob(I)alamin adenosyltransferase
MGSATNRSEGELQAACARLKRALTQVQCALFDLHEAFLQGNPDQHEALQYEARQMLDRIRALARHP